MTNKERLRAALLKRDALKLQLTETNRLIAQLRKEAAKVHIEQAPRAIQLVIP